MGWPIFTPNPSIIPTTVVGEIPISQIQQVVWNKFTNQLGSKEHFTTTCDNTPDLIITAKEVNHIQRALRKKEIAFHKVRITGQVVLKEKGIIFINIKIHWMLDWADQKYYKKSNFKKQARDFSKIQHTMTSRCIRVFSLKEKQLLKSNQVDHSWLRRQVLMIEPFTILIAHLPLITGNMTKVKNPKNTI